MLSAHDCRNIAISLSSKFGLPLLSELDEQRGFRGWVVRYKEQVEDGYAFDVWLSSTNRRAEAVFRAAPFSGPLLRAISSRLEVDTAAWNAEISAAEQNGVTIKIDMNGSLTDGKLPFLREPIRDLDVEAEVRVSSADSVAQATERAATACLALVLSNLDLDTPSQLFDMDLPEGARMRVTVNKYERNPVARMRCIEHYGSVCWICDFDFGLAYGEAGIGFIEVHHRVPISLIGRTYLVDPVADLVPVCSNCHSMAHRANPPYTPEALRAFCGLAPKTELPQFAAPRWMVTTRQWRSGSSGEQIRFTFSSAAETVSVDIQRDEILRCLEAAGDGVRTDIETGKCKLPVIAGDANIIEISFGTVNIHGSSKEWGKVLATPRGLVKQDELTLSFDLPSHGPDEQVAVIEISR